MRSSVGQFAQALHRTPHPLLLPAGLNAGRVPNPLPNFDGHYPVIGSWIIDGEAAGMGIRETSQPITDITAQFVPHVINTPAHSAEQQAEWLKQG